jgi:maleate isomerase
VTSETLAAMKAELPRAASLLPTARQMDVVGYACTSGATIIGPENIAAAIHAHHPTAKATDPITAVMAALTHLGIRKIGLLTPYVAEVSSAMQGLLKQNGFEITAFGSYEQGEEAVVARITTRSTYEAICKIARQDNVEAVFASCTNLRSFDIIEKAEKATGKPVITSNQALSWHMLKLAKPPVWPKGPGQLFSARP